MDNLSLAKPDGQVGLKKKDTTITTPEKNHRKLRRPDDSMNRLLAPNDRWRWHWWTELEMEWREGDRPRDRNSCDVDDDDDSGGVDDVDRAAARAEHSRRSSTRAARRSRAPS